MRPNLARNREPNLETTRVLAAQHVVDSMGVMSVHPLGLGLHTRTPRRRQMQAPTVSTPIAERISTIFVANELSQKTWLVTVHSPDKDKISRHKLDRSLRSPAA